MNSIYTKQIDSTISILCPEIWSKMHLVLETEHSEDKLWEELVCCVLSSQVKFELSQAVTQNLKRNGFLDIEVLDCSFENRLGECLKSPVIVDGRSIKYRFPNVKAKQIAAARENIYGCGLSLRE
ncbi:MAG: hypothetical protein K8R67_04695, partial [Desulfobacteraceae bacterium]|nr:hypothetical protein [Desulfobacteraceae bacterium]